MAVRVALRVDASAAIGSGHVRRCLALAQALDRLGADVTLVCRRHDAVSEAVVKDCSLPVRWLPAPEAGWQPQADAPPHARWAGVDAQCDAADTIAALQEQRPDWVWIDCYAFDARWHAQVRAALACRIAVMDDLADRALDADLLLDQNWNEDAVRKYAGRLVRPARLLAGPRHALLAPAFRDASPYGFHPKVRSIGIFMGGTDPGGASAKALAACRRAGFGGPVEVVSTTTNPQLAALRRACTNSPPATLTLDAPDLAAFFGRHDLQVGAGGGATWERCCLGAPTVAVMVADNQRSVVPALARLGVLRAASFEADDDDPQALHVAVRELLAHPAQRERLAQAGRKLVDGRGAERVALVLLASALQVRPAVMADAHLLHAWRNEPSVRAVSTDPSAIPLAEHLQWFAKALADPGRLLLVATVGALPVGSVRFDRRDGATYEVSIYLDPALQGLALGPRVLGAGERALVQHAGEEVTVLATVVAGNEASRRLFERCGYKGGPLAFRKRLQAAQAQ